MTLKEDGVLAFLMPKTLMTQDSYAGFRNFYIDVKNNKRLFLQKNGKNGVLGKKLAICDQFS